MISIRAFVSSFRFRLLRFNIALRLVCLRIAVRIVFVPTAGVDIVASTRRSSRIGALQAYPNVSARI